jgi:hypothetical protein
MLPMVALPTRITVDQEIFAVLATRMEAELLRRGSGGIWPTSPTIIRPLEPLEFASIGFAVPIAAFYRTTGLPQ